MTSQRLKTLACGMTISALCIFAALPAYAEDPAFVHGVAMHGDIKYPADFTHFDYVNAAAPKGGEVVLSAVGTFDSLNPFIIKGVPAVGLSQLFDSLLASASDEPFSRYGLIAEALRMPEDRSWVEFRLNKNATFHDGTPVTVEDVIFTFNTLREEGQPFYRSYYRAVAKVEKTGEHLVKFTMTEGTNQELPLIIGEMPILSKAYYQTVPFNQTTMEAPLGSGAYQVIDIKPGRSITYQRHENYWAKDLPVNRGKYNFDKIRFEYYRDATVAMEAFKGGLYDFRQENIARNWATAYDFPAAKDGRVIMEEIAHELPTGMQGYAFNIRKPLFADVRVREALTHAFDFEWSNKTLFYDAYTRSNSYFSNSELASSGIPEGQELDILNPFRDQLPAALFTTAYSLPVNEQPQDIRFNLRKAQTLLQDAGWTLKKGVLVDADGKPFTFEILLQSAAFERVTDPFLRNLERLGIKATMRTVDDSQYRRRVDSFDFDMIVHVFGQSLSPGNEQHAYWHSEKADDTASMNVIGVKHPVVDALTAQIIAAPDRETLVATARALDRVLLWQHYMIPQWHLNSFRLAYWKKFGKPAVQPPYALGFPETWWMLPINTH